MFPRPPEITFPMILLKEKITQILKNHNIVYNGELELNANSLDVLASIKKECINNYFNVISYKYEFEHGIVIYKFSKENDQFSTTIKVFLNKSE